MILVFLWLTSLTMPISRSIHVAVNGIISFLALFFLWLSNTPLYICTTSSLSICQWTFRLLVLAIINSASVNTWVHVSF